MQNKNSKINKGIMANYNAFLRLSELKNFTDSVKKIRIKYDIPLKGIRYDEKKLDNEEKTRLLYGSNSRSHTYLIGDRIKEFNGDVLSLVKLASYRTPYIIAFVRMFVFFNQIPMSFLLVDEKLSNCTILPVFDKDNRPIKISIEVTPYASINEIREFLNQNNKRIKELQAICLGGKIYKKPKIKPSKKFNDLINETRDLSLKKAQQKLSKLRPGITLEDIRVRRSLEKKKRAS